MHANAPDMPIAVQIEAAMVMEPRVTPTSDRLNPYVRTNMVGAHAEKE